MYLGIDFHGYKVFLDGVIKKGDKTMKPFLDKDGYFRIALSINKKQKKFYVHRLVYELYVGPLMIGEVCCHNDNNKTNNNCKNLRSDSQRNNISDKLGHGTWQAGETHPRAKYADSQIESLQIFIARNPKLSDSYVALICKLPRSLIYDVRRGRRKTRQQRIEERKNYVLHGA
jgi:hypothetical protein